MTFQNTKRDDVLDILILGAGMSGIGCAAYLRRLMPKKSWRIVEMRSDIGGTWDLFRYPGIRSDSDLYTFSYEFKPWESDKAIAGAEEIKSYIEETVAEYNIRPQIDFHRKAVRADWDHAEALWSVTTENAQTGDTEVYRCRWIFSATGYYDYEQGYRPDFPNENAFKGPIIHPQHWPEDLDYSGKRVAVIGSGATAVTLLPALAEKAAHTVQVQRTPTYVVPVPEKDPLLKYLRPFVSKDRLHRILRGKNARLQRLTLWLCQNFPKAMRKVIRRANRNALPADYPVDVHFKPPYDPWDQRLCAVPDNDLYNCLADGSCSIVTGKIDRFTEIGIEMQSGEHVDADIIVTATGLNLKVAGGIALYVDGQKVTWKDHIVFKGMMFDGVPNFALAVGYTNSSWTLKVGLLCEYFCRLLKEMDTRGMAVCTPKRPDRLMKLRPLLDFQAGYVLRSLEYLPRQGDGFPWEMTRDYISDRKLVRKGAVIAPEMELSAATTLSRLPPEGS